MSVQHNDRGPQQVNKKTMLSVINSQYDPLGFLAPVMVTAKLILQKVWIRQSNIIKKLPSQAEMKKAYKQAWKWQIDDDILAEWQVWLKNIKELGDGIEIPRCLHDNKPIQKQCLIGSSDASKVAIGCTVHLYTAYEDGTSTCRLVVGKSKIVDETQSLARRELDGATMLAKLMHSVEKIILPSKSYDVILYCDSTICLSWISGQPQNYKVYVANRVETIQSLYPSKFWHYIESEKNASDLNTRGITVKQLREKWYKLYYEGGNLTDTIRSCVIPPKPDFKTTQCVDLDEVKPSQVAQVKFVTAMIVTNVKSQNVIDQLFERYSSVEKILRIIAYLLRWVKKFRDKLPATFRQSHCTKLIFHSEKCDALNCVLARIQQQEWSKDYWQLAAGKTLHHKSYLASFFPYYDKQTKMIHSRSRLQQAPTLSERAKNPCLLPKKNVLLDKLLMWFHVSHKHQRDSHLIYQLRLEGMWVIHAKSAVHRVVKQCRSCRVQHAEYCTQKIDHIPHTRLQVEAPAFSYLTFDPVGPFQCQEADQQSDPPYKVWAVCYCCLVTRAVHIILVKDLTTESIIRTLRIMAATYNTPRYILCDSFRSHLKAKQEFEAVYSLPALHVLEAEFKKQNVEFAIGIPKAHHHMGAHEALIRLIRNVLHQTVERRVLPYEEMSCVLQEVAGVINRRPYGKTELMSTKRPQQEVILSPFAMLHGYFPTQLVTCDSSDDTPPNQDLVQRWEERCEITADFRSRFIRQYIMQLMQSPLSKQKQWQEQKDELHVGDIVLLKPEQAKKSRFTWPIYTVERLTEGRHGLNRSAVLRGANGLLTRSIQSVIKICDMQKK